MGVAAPEGETKSDGDDLRWRVWCLRGKEQVKGIGWDDLRDVVNGKE